MWLVQEGKNYWVALVPALAMTFIVSYFVFMSPQFLGLADKAIAVGLGVLVTCIVFGACHIKAVRKPVTEKA